jgi:rod shape determining protein RodA
MSKKKYHINIILGLIILFSLNTLMISSVAPLYLGKQIFAWIIGLGLFFVGRFLDIKQISKYKKIIFIFCCLFLLIPIFTNTITRGSRRWINIGPINIQPSETVKPLLMLNIASTQFPILHLIPVFIILFQPDLGSAISTLILLTPIVLYNKKFFKIVLIISLVGLLCSPLIWKFGLHDYQKNRITYFLNPASDPLGKGYNVIQSKIAIGSGGLFGKGYRQGTQGQLLFLPEKHTDFMFASTAEELGIIGISLIIFAYYLLIGGLIEKAYNTSNRLIFIFTLGIAIQIWFQSFINIGMNLGILPVTGIPLPFLSVGGSSLIAYLFSLGIIFSDYWEF